MRLHVSGYTDSTVRYRFLWGFYVRGFKPWLHCQSCFRGTRAEGISPLMGDTQVDLNRPTDYFYLCGFAPGPKSERGKFNLHLPVRPKVDATVTKTSAYGTVFTIEGAEEILIPDTTEQIARRGELDRRCMNFRFALQMYPTEKTGFDAARRAILLS